MNARPSVLVVAALFLSSIASSAQPRPAPVRDPAAVVQPRPGTWPTDCVARVGCVARSALPRCSAVVTADVVPLALAGEGARVMVSGRLRVQAGCTEMECAPNLCCNRCTATVQIETEGRTLSLGVPNDPAFACAGDDSGLCCGTSVPRGVVRAVGVLRHARVRGGTHTIEGASLCVE